MGNEMGNGSRGRRRPKTRWLDEIVEVTGICLGGLTESDRDREGWRRAVKLSPEVLTVAGNKIYSGISCNSVDVIVFRPTTIVFVCANTISL